MGQTSRCVVPSSPNRGHQQSRCHVTGSHGEVITNEQAVGLKVPHLKYTSHYLHPSRYLEAPLDPLLCLSFDLFTPQLSVCRK